MSEIPLIDCVFELSNLFLDYLQHKTKSAKIYSIFRFELTFRFGSQISGKSAGRATPNQIASSATLRASLLSKAFPANLTIRRSVQEKS